MQTEDRGTWVLIALIFLIIIVVGVIDLFSGKNQKISANQKQCLITAYHMAKASVPAEKLPDCKVD